MSEQVETESFEKLLDYLRQSRGFDFTAYKRTSLLRRTTKRMQAVGVQNFDDYVDYLELHPGEFEALFNTILINVTTFFRDPDVWGYLDTTILPLLFFPEPALCSHLNTNILPLLVDGRDSSSPLRVWSAGCAAGQEAYSLAM